MKYKKSNTLRTIFTWIAAVALLIFSVIFLAKIGEHFWPETTSTMPAWIQAVGSILAILTSAALLTFDHYRQRKLAKNTEDTEQANLILNTYLFGSSIDKIMLGYLESGGRNGYIVASALDFHIYQTRRSIEQHSHTPHWKMDLKLAKNWNSIFQVACKFEATLILLKTENDDRRMAVTSGATEDTINNNIKVARIKNECATLYKEFTGNEISN